MKIYISSTYRDLERYRRAVAQVLRRMGHQPIGMEDYVAEGARPLFRCLQDVKDCDAYVGILAWRYGHVPADAGSPTSVLPSGAALGQTSVTEFEFRQAVECNKERLMFVLDPEAEWPSSAFDAITGDGRQGMAISELRREVGQQHMVGYFRSADELASLVSAAVYRFEINHQMSLDSLKIEVSLNQPWVRNGPVQDSTVMEIKRVLAGPEATHGLQINIGQGQDWWMTRLYLLSALAADLTPIDVIVFIGLGDIFCGIVNPKVLRDRLLATYPLLRRFEKALDEAGSRMPDLDGEIDRRTGVWQSKMNAGGAEGNKPVFVTRRALESWLGPYWITQSIERAANENAALQIQRIMDWPTRYVPVAGGGQPVQVVDKQALTEQIARLFVREQVSRALSTTR